MELRTARLLIREFAEDDWQSVYDYRRDARYLRFYPDDIASESEVQAFVKQQITNQQLEPRLSFQMAICLPDDDRMIGNVGIRLRSLLNHQSEARQADIGYELDPHYWGRGFATEAAQAILDFGFAELDLHRILANCLAENKASARVLEKLGMRLEGRLRDSEYFKNRWWDTLIYAILDYEWQGVSERRTSARGEYQTSSEPHFRSAVPGDAPRLTEIAFAAKRYWGYPEHWIAVWRQQLIITEDYLRSHRVALAEIGSQTAGFYALDGSGDKVELDYLWVDPPHIRQGIGRALLEHACQAAASSGAERLEIIADPNAEGFYLRMGAEKSGESVYILQGQERRLPRMIIYLNRTEGD